MLPLVTGMLHPNSFTREGYQFVGWNTERDGSGVSYADEDEVTLSEDTVFYAQWEECIKITFRSAGSYYCMQKAIII